MHPARSLLLAVALCGVGFGAGSAWADDGAKDAGSSWCAQNVEECANLKARRDEFCKKNPATCETAESRRDARKAYCDGNPGRCEELRDEARQRRDDLKAWCQDNPHDCEAKKQLLRERLDQRRDHQPTSG